MTDSIKKIVLLISALVIFLIVKDILKGTYQGPYDIVTPIQVDVVNAEPILMMVKDQTYIIHPLASYDIQAGVQSKERYSTDGAAKISPIDLALAWGILNNPEIDQLIDYSQSGRWYHWRYKGGDAVSLSYISEHSANVHIIPANDNVKKQVLAIKKEEFIHLRGYLVEVTMSDQGTWKSSLTRMDTGDGACEVFYVTEVVGE